MSQVSIDAGQLRLLYYHAKHTHSTLEAWASVALEWAAHAEAEIKRLNDVITAEAIRNAQRP